MKRFIGGWLATLGYHKESILMFLIFLLIVGSLIYAWDLSFR